MNWFCHCVTVAPWNCCHCPQVRGVEIPQLRAENLKPKDVGKTLGIRYNFPTCACDYEDHKYRA